MTRIDFYLLKENYLEARNLYACRIIDKAYQQGHRVFIAVDSPEEARGFDELLWTFKDDSFIPHNVYGEPSEITPPIQIGFQPAAEYHNDILINLTDTLPEYFTKFQRAIEIIPNIEELRSKARNTYRRYRDTGCELNLYDLTKSTK